MIDHPYSLVFLDTTESTNAFAQELLKSHHPVDKTVVATFHQTRGKGQRGNHWYSGKNENLAFSIILLPELLPVAHHFMLNKVFSLGILDYLKSAGLENVHVKWPNDVLVNNCKIAGILIENSIRGDLIGSVIAGIGFNVNQVDFHGNYPIKPVSLKSATGKTYPLHDTLHSLLNALFSRYEQLFSDAEGLNTDYLKHLYRINTTILFTSENERKRGIIRNVTNDGLLEIETEEKEKLTVDQRQAVIEYI